MCTHVTSRPRTIGAVKVLVVGSGGREHALAWALARAGGVTELHGAPGNPGIAALASCHPARADDPASLVPLARELGEHRPVHRLDQSGDLGVAQPRHRRVRAHAARVRALVAVADPLVVLRGR